MVSKKARKIIDAVKQILAEYPDIQDWSLRQMYYRLVARHLLENTINNYKNLSRWLVEARETGEIDYRLFEDRARKIHGTGDGGWEDPVRFMDSYLNDFRRKYRYFNYPQWGDQDFYVEVWLEKDALARLFSTVTDELNVYTCPCRGYPSFSYVMEAVERYNEVDKPIILLYFGDYDPTGLNIPENLIERLMNYGGFYEDQLRLIRKALTIDQIRRYDLPPAPAKKSDARYKGFVETTGTDQVVELDALEPRILQQLVRDSVMDYIDLDRWNDTVQKTRDTREVLQRIFEEAKLEVDQSLMNKLKEM